MTPLDKTNVFGTVYDSTGVTFNGYLNVTLSSPLANNTDNEVYFSLVSKTPIVNGVVNVDLEPSESQGISYQFEVWRTNPGLPDSLVWQFYAQVPRSVTPIALASLTRNTGISRDNLDQSLSAVVRTFYNDSTFWSRLNTEVFQYRGVWSSNAIYASGSIVQFQGDTFLYINQNPTLGNTPPMVGNQYNEYWGLLAKRGLPGSGVVGENSAYSEVGWLNNLDVPTKNALRNHIVQLATKTDLTLKADKVNPILTNARSATSPVSGDVSTLLATTEWVQNIINAVRLQVIPVGQISFTAAASPPIYWLAADGSYLLRSAYPKLFEAIGTIYNLPGDTDVTRFRLPDARERQIMGLGTSPGRGAANLYGSANEAVRVLGGYGGSATAQLTISNLPSMSVSFPIRSISSEAANIGLSSGGVYVNRPIVTAPDGNNFMNSATFGSNQPFSLANPYLTLLPIIFAGE